MKDNVKIVIGWLLSGMIGVGSVTAIGNCPTSGACSLKQKQLQAIREAGIGPTEIARTESLGVNPVINKPGVATKPFEVPAPKPYVYVPMQPSVNNQNQNQNQKQNDAEAKNQNEQGAVNPILNIYAPSLPSQGQDSKVAGGIIYR